MQQLLPAHAGMFAAVRLLLDSSSSIEQARSSSLAAVAPRMISVLKDMLLSKPQHLLLQLDVKMSCF